MNLGDSVVHDNPGAASDRRQQEARAFYTELAQDYEVKIRQLVPRYDDMVVCMLELLRRQGVRSLLDIGAGPGNVTEQILLTLPDIRIIACEVSPAMVRQASRRLERYGDRVEIEPRDVLELPLLEQVDAVVSTLVLHNIDTQRKPALLRAIRNWLRPGGVFLWGDLIRFEDADLQDHFMQERRSFALAAGCPPALVEVNFAKESRDDFPCTVAETVALAGDAGFQGIEIVWMHDTFALFVLSGGDRRPPGDGTDAA